MLSRPTLLMAAILLTGCSSFGIPATGSLVMLKGEVPIQPLPVGQVQLILNAENQDYQIVALINASASVGESVDIAIAEGKALQELKQQAAQAGANGIIDIVREVLAGGTLTSTMKYGETDNHNNLRINGHNDKDRQTISTGQTSVSRSYTVYFRGKAVRLDKMSSE